MSQPADLDAQYLPCQGCHLELAPKADLFCPRCRSRIERRFRGPDGRVLRPALLGRYLLDLALAVLLAAALLALPDALRRAEVLSMRAMALPAALAVALGALVALADAWATRGWARLPLVWGAARGAGVAALIMVAALILGGLPMLPLRLQLGLLLLAQSAIGVIVAFVQGPLVHASRRRGGAWRARQAQAWAILWLIPAVVLLPAPGALWGFALAAAALFWVVSALGRRIQLRDRFDMMVADELWSEARQQVEQWQLEMYHAPKPSPGRRRLL